VYRLKTFVDRAAVSTLTGDIFDDAATGQGIAEFLFESHELRPRSPKKKPRSPASVWMK
jgi:hypothetical protein